MVSGRVGGGRGIARAVLALWLVLGLGLGPSVGHVSAQPSAELASAPECVALGECDLEANVPDAASLVVAGPPPMDASARALLLCHAVVSESGPHGRWDTFLAPDVVVELSVGTFHARARGPDDQCEVDVSFAGVPLHRGDRLEAVVWDDDVPHAEQIDALSGTFDGTFPIRLAHDTTTVVCQLGSGSRAEAAAVSAFGRATSIAARLETARPVLTDATLGWSTADWTAAVTQIALGMAYVGRDDPRATSLRDRASAARAAFHTALARAVSDAVAAGTTTATLPDGRSIRILGTLATREAIGREYPTMLGRAIVIDLALGPAPGDVYAAIGAADVVDATGAIIERSGSMRHAGDAPRIGVGLARDVRPALLRVGTGSTRTVLAIP